MSEYNFLSIPLKKEYVLKNYTRKHNATPKRRSHLIKIKNKVIDLGMRKG